MAKAKKTNTNPIKTVEAAERLPEPAESTGVVDIFTLPANIPTGLLMYANSHYYFTLDCCVSGDRHTSVLISSRNLPCYPCNDPNKEEITPTVWIEENRGDAGNYLVNGIDLDVGSPIVPASPSGGVTMRRIARILIDARTEDNQEVPPFLLNKVFSLLQLRFDGRTNNFLVFEPPTGGFDRVGKFLTVPRTVDNLLFFGQISVNRSPYTVSGLGHD